MCKSGIYLFLAIIAVSGCAHTNLRMKQDTKTSDKSTEIVWGAIHGDNGRSASLSLRHRGKLLRLVRLKNKVYEGTIDPDSVTSDGLVVKGNVRKTEIVKILNDWLHKHKTSKYEKERAVRQAAENEIYKLLDIDDNQPESVITALAKRLKNEGPTELDCHVYVVEHFIDTIKG